VDSSVFLWAETLLLQPLYISIEKPSDAGYLLSSGFSVTEETLERNHPNLAKKSFS